MPNHHCNGCTDRKPPAIWKITRRIFSRYSEDLLQRRDSSRIQALKTPRIGIALAAYQPDAKTFLTQLETIADQSFQEWVCVVTLDSPLVEISDHLGRFLNDPRFYFSENTSRLGTKKNFEQAARILFEKFGDIDYLAFSDQDDIWYPNKLKRLLAEIQKHPPLSLVHSDMNVILEDKADTSETVWSREHRGVWNCTTLDLIIRNVVAGAALLMDAMLWQRFPVIPDEVEFHDRWAALIASHHGGVYPIHEPLYAYRIHDSNVLGMSPYRGLVHGGSIGLAKERFQESFSISEALKTAGMTGHSLGIVSLFLRGLRKLLSDPGLARACFARAVGKFFSIFTYYRIYYFTPLDNPNKNNSVAVVVTFNPDAEFQKRLASLKTIFDKIVVIDNKSDRSLPRLDGVKQLRLPENLGIGAAINEGAREATEEWKDTQWLSFFDQDSEVAPEYLSEMSRVYDLIPNTSRMGVIGCNYIERASGKTFIPKQDEDAFNFVSHCITSGSVVRKDLWLKTKGYNESLFIDHVDDEFCFRVRAHGFEVIQTTEPLMTHKIGAQTRANFLGRQVWVWNHSAFRWFYFTRNLAFLWRSYGFREFRTLLSFTRHLFKRATKMILLENDKIAKLRKLLSGLITGFFSPKNIIIKQ
ncbi:MAG: glycosyltransferase [Xanthomonadaceae bacterium]|nr:glycosyltransferase [Xanthomonadaceae bacterium]